MINLYYPQLIFLFLTAHLW